jgi:hypothetical protein
VPAFTIAGAFELLAALVAFVLLSRAHRAAHTAEPHARPEEAMPTT